MISKACAPSCEFFRCGQRALQVRGQKIWCTFTNDTCDVPKCAYVQCLRNKLLTGNLCGLTIKRVTEDKTGIDDFGVKISYISSELLS